MIFIMPVLLESRITVFPTMSVCPLFFYLKTKKVLTKVALSDIIMLLFYQDKTLKFYHI